MYSTSDSGGCLLEPLELIKDMKPGPVTRQIAEGRDIRLVLVYSEHDDVSSDEESAAFSELDDCRALSTGGMLALLIAGVRRCDSSL